MADPTRLFTFIFDYDGGTYIAQVTAPSVEEAYTQWLGEVMLGSLFNICLEAKQDLEYARDEALVPLSGVVNVWCNTFLLREKLALVNVVLTSETKL